MQTHDFSNPLTAPIAVGSGDLLGCWLWFNLFIISLAAFWVGAFVITNLPTLREKILVRLQVCKLASSPLAIWTLITGLINWLKILKLAAKLTVLDLKTRYLRRKCRVLLHEQRALLLQKVNHVLAQTRRGSDSDDVFCGVNSTHKSNARKQLNEKS